MMRKIPEKPKGIALSRKDRIMFLLDHAPQASQRTRQAARKLGSVIYELYIQPRTENEAVYMSLSRQFQGLRRTRSMEERTQMHLYAHSLLFDNGHKPAGLDGELAGLVEAMVFASRFHYRRSHPFAARLLKAA